MNLIISKCWQGQKKKGVNLGAEILSQQFKYFKNIDQPTQTIINEDNFNIQQNGYKDIYNKNMKVLKSGNLPINLGGDHSIAGGSLASSIKMFGNDLRVVWVDAHSDINTYDSSKSGNYHGMPLASAIHLMKPWVKAPALNTDQIIYIGLRDLDPFEKDFIRKKNIINYSNEDVLEKGIENIFKEIEITLKNKKIHYSFDIDSVDPVIAPSTGTPVKNGLFCNHIFEIQKKICELGDVINCDFVEYNPNIGNNFDSEITKNTYRKILNNFVENYKIS